MKRYEVVIVHRLGIARVAIHARSREEAAEQALVELGIDYASVREMTADPAEIAAAPPKSTAWSCQCGRLNAPFRNACTACGADKKPKQEKTA